MNDNLREYLGKLVRKTWVEYCKTLPSNSISPHWVWPWEQISPEMQEVDRRIGEQLYLKGVQDATKVYINVIREVFDIDIRKPSANEE